MCMSIVCSCNWLVSVVTTSVFITTAPPTVEPTSGTNDIDRDPTNISMFLTCTLVHCDV